MIQANELREGNWVIPMYELQGEDHDYDYGPPVMFHWQNLFEAHKHYKAIPITDEILIKCGFEKDSDGCYKLLNCLYYVVNKLQIAINYTPIINAPCESLHQLQNLYFALTGNELNIDLS